jgi:hypothetical protein
LVAEVAEAIITQAHTEAVLDNQSVAVKHSMTEQHVQ